ncbi:hypothetical protein MFIFM68171_00094 [Madurella fahalii]|uniref:Uncharacterized protein n=1 Tax=Madurella fahalii TaxID=1157608 RepID=A0ABQ0FWV6_9PEZI
MESFSGGPIVKPDPHAIKRETSFPIKSEFEPSLSSLPLASPAPGKKESHEDKKSALGSIPERNTRAGRSRRRRFHGNAIVHRVNGYRIAAHYGRGKVDLTVTHADGRITILSCSGVDWIKAEREVFHKLRRAHFHVEPVGGEGALDDALNGHGSSASLFTTTSEKIQVAIDVRRRDAPPGQYDYYNSLSTSAARDLKEETKDTKMPSIAFR